MKAEAIAAAHSQRVDTEADAYFQAETRKAEAHFATMQVNLPPSMYIALWRDLLDFNSNNFRCHIGHLRTWHKLDRGFSSQQGLDHINLPVCHKIKRWNENNITSISVVLVQILFLRFLLKCWNENNITSVSVLWVRIILLRFLLKCWNENNVMSISVVSVQTLLWNFFNFEVAAVLVCCSVGKLMLHVNVSEVNDLSTIPCTRIGGYCSI